MSETKIIFLANDHGGLSLRDPILETIQALGFQVKDYGTNAVEPVDYPLYAQELCRKMEIEEDSMGILICGSGIGMSIAANRYPHIRAALCHKPTLARLARAHNNANVLCLGGRFITPQESKDIVKAFLLTPFEGDRHQRRINQLNLFKKEEDFLT